MGKGRDNPLKIPKGGRRLIIADLPFREHESSEQWLDRLCDLADIVRAPKVKIIDDE